MKIKKGIRSTGKALSQEMAWGLTGIANVRRRQLRGIEERIFLAERAAFAKPWGQEGAWWIQGTEGGPTAEEGSEQGRVGKWG